MQRLLDSLDRDTTVVTAGRRLARHLLAAHARERLAAGETVWERPDILPWASWQQRLWESAAESLHAQILLTDEQELTLWERVINQHTDPERALLQVPAAAKNAREAWSLLHQWRLDQKALHEHPTDDVQAFVKWAGAFSRECENRNLLDDARLTATLQQTLAKHPEALPKRLVLAGFDELSPAQSAFTDELASLGVKVEQFNPAEREGKAVTVGYPDTEAEVLAAARWTRARLDADPAARIGIVVPELATLRPTLTRILDDVLCAETALPGSIGRERPYNLSLGIPLADYPLVHIALAVIELPREQLTVERVGRLLRSPHVAGAEAEMTTRAALDARLRSLGGVQLKLQRVVNLAVQEEKPHQCPELADRLQRLRDESKKLPRRQPPAGWAASFARLLNAVGWPGERGLDSTEHQTVEAWRELLGTFSALGTVAGEIEFEEALSRLRRLAGERLFQPESPQAPVQVLGVLEAAGLQFDKLWVMGLCDDVWPAAPRPNPLLPMRLQRAAATPHASAERELAFAKSVTQRLIASADEVVLSYPQQHGDRALRPSPLITRLEQEKPNEMDVAAPPLHRDAIHEHRSVERITDRRAPPLEDPRVAGGTAVFKDQAACPFRATALHRLAARTLDEPVIGLSAAERGQLIHHVLEHVWGELKNYQALIDATDERLDALLQHAVAGAVDAMTRRQPDTFTKRFTEIECARLANLAREWLNLEKQRAPFEVAETEQRHALSAAGLELDARIDRIDRLVDGQLVIIDYKTGKASIQQWDNFRFEEPQLPLYVMHGPAEQDQVAAVAFGQLRRGDTGFIGVSRIDDVAPGIKPVEKSRLADSWHDLLAQWAVRLDELGKGFREGEAAVNPKQRTNTCRYCHLPPLCRIHELDARLGRMDAEEDDE